MSRCGVIALRMVMTCRFISKSTPSCSSVGFFKMAASRSCYSIVEVRQHGKERVDQGVHDDVEHSDLRCGNIRRMMACEAGVNRCEGRAVALMNADDEFLGDEAVHLRHALAIACHAEGDDMDELVVVVDSGPLAELVGRLDGYGWKWNVLTNMPVTSSSGPGSWMSRSNQKNAPPASACSIPYLSGVAEASVLSQRSLHRDDSPSPMGFRRWMLPDRARPVRPQPPPPLPRCRPRPLRPELHRDGAPRRPTGH